MEAGPLDRHSRDEDRLPEPAYAVDGPAGDALDGFGSAGGLGAADRADGSGAPMVESLPADGLMGGGLAADGLVSGVLADDGPDQATSPSDEHELRPARRLRLWHTAPIVCLGVLGSLMFAFPLAFGLGGGAVVAMLGLLLTAVSAGWGVMVARRVGYTWPGLPPRGSGHRPDWRYVAGYALICLLIAALAVWRVARLH